MVNKLKIGVSACLLGQKVRYDGKGKKHTLIVDVFAQQYVNSVELIPFCPEVAIGLGVPRPKIQLLKLRLAKKSEQIRVLGVNNHTLDVTDELKSYSQTFLLQYPDISGVIVKSKSPSCGFQSTPLFVTQDVVTQDVVTQDVVTQDVVTQDIVTQDVVNQEGTNKAEHLYEQVELSSGFFVQALLALKPDLKIIEDTSLKRVNDCLNWLNDLQAQENN